MCLPSKAGRSYWEFYLGNVHQGPKFFTVVLIGMSNCPPSYALLSFSSLCAAGIWRAKKTWHVPLIDFFVYCVHHRVHVGVGENIRGVYLPSQLERTLQLYLWWKIEWRGGGALLQGWADFTITMECTPESGYYHSVYSVV